MSNTEGTNLSYADTKDEAPQHLEHPTKDTEASLTQSIDLDCGFDPVAIKQTIRRIDLRLIPVLSAMYIIAGMDRTAIAKARTVNNSAMDKRLGLSVGNRYSIMTLMFFVPYILFEVPSQFGLRRFGPRIWMGGAVIAWGLVTLFHGLCKSWIPLTVVRAILGTFEAVLFPGSVYLISCWYPRRYMAARTTIFYSISQFFASFSALLSYGISLAHGARGLEGWQWIFIVYGVITISIGIIGYLFVVDFPDRATFLSPEQKTIINALIERDRKDFAPDPLTLRKAMAGACEWRVWVFGLMLCAGTITIYALAFFLPTILASMGFDNTLSIILSTPPMLYAVIPAVISALVSDRYKIRGHMIIVNALFLIAGVAMFSQLPRTQVAGRFIGVCFAAGGATANIPLTTSWAQTTIRSQSKRAFYSAFIISWGGIGGIMASTLFMQKEAKSGYPTGIYVTLGMNCYAVVAAFGLIVYFKHRNKMADRGEVILEGDVDFRY